MSKIEFTTHNLLNTFKKAARYPNIACSVFYRQVLYNFYKKHWFNKGRARTLPCEIVVLISRKCFLDCVTCGTKSLYGSDDRFSDFFELGHLKKIADELQQWRSPVYVKFTGGEPATHPNFFEILEYYADKRIPVRLSTNGAVFKVKEKAYALVDSGVEVITISIDGMSQDHNAIREVQNLYQSIVEGIYYIKERRMQKKRYKPMIQVTTVISKVNYRLIDIFVRELNKIGIDWFHLVFVQYVREENGNRVDEVCRSLGGIGDGKWRFWMNKPLANIDVNPEILESNFKKIFSNKQSFPITMINIGGYDSNAIHKWHFSNDLIHKSLCANPYISMVLLPPGLAAYCIDFPQFFYGDVRNQSLREIWFSEKAQDYRKKFLKYYLQHKENMPQCLRCGWRFW